jgi:hypothetical protein
MEADIRDHVRRIVASAKPKTSWFGSASGAGADATDADVQVRRSRPSFLVVCAAPLAPCPP